MITSAVFIDGRGAAELTPNHDRNILVQAALMQIFDQGAEPLVEQRQILPA